MIKKPDETGFFIWQKRGQAYLMSHHSGMLQSIQIIGKGAIFLKKKHMKWLFCTIMLMAFCIGQPSSSEGTSPAWSVDEFMKDREGTFVIQEVKEKSPWVYNKKERTSALPHNRHLKWQMPSSDSKQAQ